MNTGPQAAREARKMVDLDSNPTKLIEIVEVGQQLLIPAIERPLQYVLTISGTEPHGGELQNPSKRLVMPVDVEHGGLVLVRTRRDQEVGDRYAMLTVRRELTLSGQRDRDRRGVDAELMKRVKLDLELLKSKGGPGAAPRHRRRDTYLTPLRRWTDAPLGCMKRADGRGG